MEGELKKVTQLTASVVGSLCYCYLVSSKIPRGWFRLLSLLPVLYLFTVLPLSLSSAVDTFVSFLTFTWMTNFKLLLFAFGQGPLSSSNDGDPPISLAFFISVGFLPVKIKHGEGGLEGPEKRKGFPLRFSVLLFAVLVGIVQSYGDQLPRILVMYAYIWILYLWIDILVSASIGLFGAFAGVEMEHPSDEPYLSTSLQELWGRRWNLTVSNALRDTVYKPVRWAASPVVGRRWAPVLGILASFLVSGMMHELVFYYVTRVPPTWEMTGFFLLQGLAIVAEGFVKRAIGGKWMPPAILSRALTLGFAFGTSCLLFFPPVMRSGADQKMIDDVRFFVQLAAGKAKHAFAVST